MQEESRIQLKVGVLAGGISSERDISLKSGQAVFRSLKDSQVNAAFIEIDAEGEAEIISQLHNEKIDLVFNVLHGKFGEDGGIQDILERNHIPYIGSDATSSRLTFNKADCQQLFKSKNITVPEFEILVGKEQELTNLSFPVYVKPAKEGSSIGISYAQNQRELSEAIEKAFSYDSTLLIDQAIIGRELTVGILDNVPLPIVEIKPGNRYFDYTSKYEKGKSEYCVPADLDKKLAESIQQTALSAYNLCGCRHLARVDFMLDSSEAFYLLEINTIPGFTETSLLPMAAKQAGINFNQLCLNLIGSAHGQKEKISTTSRH